MSPLLTAGPPSRVLEARSDGVRLADEMRHVVKHARDAHVHVALRHVPEEIVSGSRQHYLPLLTAAAYV